MNELHNLTVWLGLLLGIARGVYVCATATKSDESPVMVIGRIFRFPVFVVVVLLWAAFVLPFTLALTTIYLAAKAVFYPLVPVWCFFCVVFGILVHDLKLATGFTKAVADIYATYWDRAPKQCWDILHFGLNGIEHFAAYGFSDARH